MEDRTPIPTVSRALDDGTLIELVYDPRERATSLAVARPDSAPTLEATFELPSGERLIPYSAGNNLIVTECILLPSDIGEFTTKDELLADVRAFIGRYVDLSPTFEEIAAHYVLLSWVYDAFSELPYLRFRGDFGTGKTRALLAIGSLCYKPFFASGASTVSPIFHILEAFGGTLILDEADFRFSDATADLTKILNNGNMRGLPVLRTMTNRHRELNPQAFRVFGPKLIGMRQSFADPALESRFITEDTHRRALRSGIPIQVPNELRDEARALRNRLLAWRFASRHDVSSDPSRLVGGLGPRASQTALSLLSVIDDEGLREAVCSLVGLADEQLRETDHASLERLMVAAVLGAFEHQGSAGATIGVVTNLFNEAAETALGSSVSNRWVGHFIRSKLGLQTKKSQGVYAVPLTDRPRVMRLADRYGLSVAAACSPDAQSTASAGEPVT